MSFGCVMAIDVMVGCFVMGAVSLNVKCCFVGDVCQGELDGLLVKCWTFD